MPILAQNAKVSAAFWKSAIFDEIFLVGSIVVLKGVISIKVLFKMLFKVCSTNVATPLDLSPYGPKLTK